MKIRGRRVKRLNIGRKLSYRRKRNESFEVNGGKEKKVLTWRKKTRKERKISKRQGQRKRKRASGKGNKEKLGKRKPPIGCEVSLRAL